MASLDELSNALINADKAGDVNAARALAAEINRVRGMTPTQPPPGVVIHGGDGVSRVAGQPELSTRRTGDAETDTGRAAILSRRAGGAGMGEAGRALMPVFQGVSAGFGDEAVSGLSAATGGDYAATQELQRQELERQRSEHPVASAAGEMAGGAALGASALAGGLSVGARAAQAGRGLGGIAARSAADGAAMGALSGFGAGDTFRDRAIGAGIGAGVGTAIGGAVPYALGGLSNIGRLASPKPVIPTAEELASRASDAYKAADQAGVVYSADAMKRLAAAVQARAANFGYHPANQPGAEVALNEINRLTGDNVTLKGLDTARKVMSGSYRPGNKSNNSLIHGMMDDLDNVVAKPGPGDVIMGDAPGAADAIALARELYARSAKANKVETLLDRAGVRAARTGSGGNADNTTRQEISKLLTDPKQARGFTPDELDMARTVVEGSAGQNALRLAGKLSPSGNGLMAALHAGAIGATSGASAPLAVAGAGAKFAADKITQRNAEKLLQVILAGGDKSALQRAPNIITQALESDPARMALVSALAGRTPSLVPSR